MQTGTRPQRKKPKRSPCRAAGPGPLPAGTGTGPRRGCSCCRVRGDSCPGDAKNQQVFGICFRNAEKTLFGVTRRAKTRAYACAKKYTKTSDDCSSFGVQHNTTEPPGPRVDRLLSPEGCQPELTNTCAGSGTSLCCPRTTYKCNNPGQPPLSSSRTLI